MAKRRSGCRTPTTPLMRVTKRTAQHAQGSIGHCHRVAIWCNAPCCDGGCRPCNNNSNPGYRVTVTTGAAHSRSEAEAEMDPGPDSEAPPPRRLSTFVRDGVTFVRVRPAGEAGVAGIQGHKSNKSNKSDKINMRKGAATLIRIRIELVEAPGKVADGGADARAEREAEEENSRVSALFGYDGREIKQER